MLHILHCPLSGPDLIYISLLIIFCIIEYVTNKTLNPSELVLNCSIQMDFWIHMELLKFCQNGLQMERQKSLRYLQLCFENEQKSNGLE